MNGYLNTGKGGTVYLGILDDGKVIGLAMTQYQVSNTTTTTIIIIIIKLYVNT